MLEIRTTSPDAIGYCARCFEIADGVFLDPETKTVFVLDTDSAVSIRRVTTDQAPQATVTL